MQFKQLMCARGLIIKDFTVLYASYWVGIPWRYHKTNKQAPNLQLRTQIRTTQLYGLQQ